MKLAYVMTTEPGETDRLLSAFARSCLDRGLPVAGLVQTNTEGADPHHCDMDVKVLPEGPVFRISQSLGRESRGCRLDSAALEAAVAEVDKTLAAAPALVIINKFGKREAEGGGFREVIGRCLGAGTPVIVGVNALNRQAFLDFAGDMAEPVPAGIEALGAWRARSLAGTTRAA